MAPRKRSPTPPNIYRYTDHLAYLRDAYTARRAADSSFSHRFVSTKLGIQSSAGFAHLLSGYVKIADRYVPILAKLFKLDLRETEYFELLVGFSQAASPQERRYGLERLTWFRNVHVDTVAPHRYEFYMQWYYSAVRALMTIFPFRGDYAALGARLDPPLSPYEARTAVDLLHKLGFVERRANGYWRVTQRDITSSDDETSRTAVRRFNHAAMELAKQAIERFDASLREIATLTLGVSPAMAEDIRAEIRAFRRKAVAMVGKAGAADRVYQINLQFFPVTNPHTHDPQHTEPKEGRSS